MRFHVLACDYDGTLALHGRVDGPTLAALERVRATDRKLVLVTGRQLAELLTIFPQADLFERIVAENGALLYQPETGEEKLLADSPPAELIHTLRQRGVEPAIGHVVVATWRPMETIVFQAIRDLGLDWQVILNKDAVMALPSGINKGTGLAAALQELGMTSHEAVGMGDAENDHALFNLCECGVAVANALPVLKERADWVTQGDHGAGVIELADALVANDLQFLAPRLQRHHVLLGHQADGAPAALPGYGVNVLIAGTSTTNRRRVTRKLIDGLVQNRYQFCLLNSDGAFDTLKGVVTLGSDHSAPMGDEAVKLLAGGQNLGVNLQALPHEKRPSFLLALLDRLRELRVRAGRPHWLILDNAEQLLPAPSEPTANLLAQGGTGLAVATAHPSRLPRPLLECLDTRIVTERNARDMFAEFCAVAGEDLPELDALDLDPGEALLWKRFDRRPARARIAHVPEEIGKPSAEVIDALSSR